MKIVRNFLLLLYLLLFIIVGIMTGCAQSPGPSVPEAKDGCLDLEGWDFKRNGSLELVGEWKFIWMESNPEFIAPEYDASSWENYQVPNTWNTVKNMSHGYGWYRLRIIHMPRTNEALGLFLRRSQTASRLYVNGREILTDGTPGESMETTIPCQLPQVVPLGEADEMVISWHIANFHNRRGGPYFSPKVGVFKDLAYDLWKRDLGEVLIIGFMLIMGVYNLILWLMRRKEVSSLYFALFCLMSAVRVLVMFNSVQRIFIGMDVFDIRMRLEYFSSPACVWLFAAFLHTLFPDEIPKRFISITQWVTVFLCAAVMFVPSWISTNFVMVLQVLLVMVIVFIISAVFRAVIKKREWALIVFIGLMLLLATMVYDVLLYNVLNLNGTYLIGWGVLGIIICYAIILSYRFTHALETSEQTSLELRKEVERQISQITEQNRELENLIREKTDLFINYNHETRTPLMLIGNYLDKLVADYGENNDFKMIKQNIDKMKRDVDNSLSLEKLIRNQAFYEHDQTVSFSKFLQEKITLFHDLAKSKGIELVQRGMAECYVRIDPSALDKIINNLLENAIRYTGKGGHIEVSLRSPGGRIEFKVRDTGRGIPKEQLSHIFKPYYQICRTKGNLQGMGMGLSIVKRIMDTIHGSITVESRENEGSVFTLSFSSCPPPPAGQRPSGSPECTCPLTFADPELLEETYSEEKDTLLLIEDNRSMLAFLLESLRDGYNVFYACSGKEAIAKLDAIPSPHLIISDIMMDEMDGYEFLDALLKSEKYRSIPLVFLTAKTSQDEKISGLTKGAVDVLHKPIKIAELKIKIRSLIDNQKAQREALVREMKDKIGDLLRPAGPGGFPAEKQEENFKRYNITQREREIILLLFQGLEYKEVSDILAISLNTLKPHIRNIYNKCRVKNRMELFNAIRSP